MVKEFKKKLTLDRPATYEIKVPGHLEESWADWDGRMTVSVESDDDGLPVTTLTGALTGCLAGSSSPALFPWPAIDLGHLH